MASNRIDVPPPCIVFATITYSSLMGIRPSGEVATDDPIVRRAVADALVFEVEPRLGSSSADRNTPGSLVVPAATFEVASSRR